MTYQAPAIQAALEALPPMPTWIASPSSEIDEDPAFFSGAALAHLHLILNSDVVPAALLRARLAVQAAELCVGLAGRRERVQELRDALAFLQPGDSPGPAGEIYHSWQTAVARPLSGDALSQALPELDPSEHDFGQGAPVSRATAILEPSLRDRPRDTGTAFLRADAALADGLGWTHIVPLFALGFGARRRAAAPASGDVVLDTHRAVLRATREITHLATDLARRTAHLSAVAPKLRAKGAERAVHLFLTRDAVAPNALTSLRSSRAARRFCDRLVELGAVRELTGRPTFRLYGI